MELSKLGKVIDTDILVLGGGTNGCGAALGARDSGARVLVIDKGSLESCGQPGSGQGGYNTYLSTGPEWDTAEGIAEYYCGGAEAMCATLSTELFMKGVAPWMIPLKDRLESAGVEFVKDPDDPSGYLRHSTCGMKGKWTIWFENGRYIKRLLAKEVRRSGADILGQIMLTKILVQSRRAVGAVGFNYWTGEFHIFRAKCVVLSLAVNALRMAAAWTGNPFIALNYPYNTGSGQVMAYDAGARQIALEKASASPLPLGLGAPGLNTFTGHRAHFIDAQKERFLLEYDPRGEDMPRHRIVMAMREQQIRGNVPLYLDCRHFSDRTVQEVRDSLSDDGHGPAFDAYFEQRGIDMQKEPIEYEVEGWKGGGSLLVNDHFESSLRGLFGYNPGTFSLALCAGYSSAVAAVEDARKLKEFPEVGTDLIEEEKERVYAPLNRDAGYHWRQYEDVVRQVMRYYVGTVRSKQSMERALEKLKVLEGYAGEIKAKNYHELLRTHEAIHLVRYCQLATRAALERKESGRDVYRRIDYPEQLPEWNGKQVVIWQEKGEQKVSVVG
ncbi:FAD-binding protein [Chloroflexota bacterium]